MTKKQNKKEHLIKEIRDTENELDSIQEAITILAVTQNALAKRLEKLKNGIEGL